MYNIAVVGATGNTGKEILRLIRLFKMPFDNVYALASDNSSVNSLSFGSHNIKVHNIDNFDFHNADIVFFATHESVSKKYLDRASKSCKLVIDLSSYLRKHDSVPLIIPEINFHNIDSNVIANPNCVVIPILLVIDPLNKYADLDKMVISTYQSVSGAGRLATDNLHQQAKHRITSNDSIQDTKNTYAFNIIPKIDSITSSGDSIEEIKIIEETQKILKKYIEISVTCARVPVFVGHCISIHAIFKSNISKSDAEKVLSKIKGVTVSSDNQSYYTSLDCAGRNEVFVSRIRQGQNNSLNLWICSDNLIKGSSLNALQIAMRYLNI